MPGALPPESADCTACLPYETPSFPGGLILPQNGSLQTFLFGAVNKSCLFVEILTLFLLFSPLPASL